MTTPDKPHGALPLFWEGGYSTHGHWAPLHEIYQLEVHERGNAWFDDADLNHAEWQAIWLTRLLPDALVYDYGPEVWNVYKNGASPSSLTPEEQCEWMDFVALSSDANSVYFISTLQAFAVLDFQDEGVLWIRKASNTI
jgi:hypothetical protein